MQRSILVILFIIFAIKEFGTKNFKKNMQGYKVLTALFLLCETTFGTMKY